MSKFCDRLREVRGSMTQSAFAAPLKLNQQTYQRYESGVREPNLETLRLIGVTYDVSLDWLLGRTDERTPSSTVAPAATVRPTPAARSPEPTLADLQAQVKSLTKRVAALEFAPSSEARRPATAAG